MITRKLGAILRGKATPFQLVTACVLGALLGFAPGLLQAPALYLLLIAALLFVNANLGLALLVAGLTRLLALVAVSVSFQIGRVLLDGPTAGLAETVVNAPILAWCGLQYYAVAGGQLLGLVIGLVTGLLIARSVGGFRRKMIAASENPSRLNELAAKPWARFSLWLFFGGTGKKTWEQKAGTRMGNPVRVWGAALIVLGLGGAYLGQRALAGPLARRGLQAGLERANGATVDVGAAQVNLGEGQFFVAGLALADPNELTRDLFRAQQLEADFDQVDILRRRVHVARLVVSEARSGAPREKPGERLAPPPVEEEEELPPAGIGDYSLEEVLGEYETWKGRLTQARSWLERLAGEEEEEGETLAERLAREVGEQGWLSVAADHLIEDSPTFRLSELVVDGLTLDELPGRTFDLRGHELSTQPGLVDAPPRLELASRDGAIGFSFDLAPASRGGGDGALRFHWKGLSVDDALARLRLPGPSPLTGGTLDLEIDGSWAGGNIGWVDLPLRATLRDTVVTMEGVQPTPVEELVLPIGLSGPIDAPRIRFENQALVDALVKAGKTRLANEVRGQLDARLGDDLEGLKERAGIELPEDLDVKVPEDAKGVLDGLFGGKKDKDGQ